MFTADASHHHDLGLVQEPLDLLEWLPTWRPVSPLEVVGVEEAFVHLDHLIVPEFQGIDISLEFFNQVHLIKPGLQLWGSQSWLQLLRRHFCCPIECSKLCNIQLESKALVHLLAPGL